MILNLLITAIYTLFSIVGAFSQAGTAAQDTGKEWDLSAYLQKVDRRVDIMKKLSFGLLPADRFEVEFDPVIEEMFAEIEGYSGFDGEAVAESWPDFFYYHRWLYKIAPWAVYNLRDKLLDMAWEFEAEGDWSRRAIYGVLGISVGMPTKMTIAAEEVPRFAGIDDVYEIVIIGHYADGETRRMEIMAWYDAGNGVVNHDNDAEGGIVGTGFAMNVRDGWAYNTQNSPQRGLGYMKLYDDLLLTTTNMVDIDTIRLKFPYNGKDWMIQLWKGRYFITTGMEVGIYNKPTDRFIEFYDAQNDDNDNVVTMSSRLFVDGDETPWIERNLRPYWWMTGYAVRDKVFGPDKITLDTDIVPLDAEFSAALTEALDKETKLSYTVDASGMISIHWPSVSKAAALTSGSGNSSALPAPDAEDVEAIEPEAAEEDAPEQAEEVPAEELQAAEDMMLPEEE